MKKLIILFLTIALSNYSFGQNGFLRGKITDSENGEGLMGATIAQQATTIGTSADFDGNYSLTLSEGIYTIEFRFFSYQTKIVSNVVIKSGQVTLLSTDLGEATTELGEVIVTAEQIRDNEVALLTVQRKSANTIDGISAAAFKKVGDNDLGVAMKRVTGVSIQGGKYVYVRGLGDRYTKTVMNGMSIPGLDPDRNAVQMDIFPTNSIENVVVFKTFTPDLSADFSGGMVNIETKSFPDEKYTNLTVGVGYNPEMHFKSQNLTYSGGKTDYLGFDDGTRMLPIAKTDDIPHRSENPVKSEYYTRQFSPTLSAKQSMSFMNTQFSVSHGNQVDRGKMKIGYTAILNYRNTVEYYDNVLAGFYLKDSDRGVNDLVTEQARKGSQGRNDVFWSALLAGAVKFNTSSISIGMMQTQNGTSSAMDRISSDLVNNPSVLKEDILTYTQRSITNGFVIGKHKVNQWEIEWKASTNKSRIYEPDFRETKIEIHNDGTYGLNGAVGAGIDRYYRDLNETNSTLKLDLTLPYGINNKLKFGGMSTLKHRTFEILNYAFSSANQDQVSGEANELLAPENIWTAETQKGIYVSGNRDLANEFDANQNVYAAYVMTEMEFFSSLKVIYGLRAEAVQMHYTGANQSQRLLNDTLIMNKLDMLPSINLVYALNENMNLRTSFNKTLARPTFSEKSNAQIYDPISKITKIGNLNLQETHVNNYDLRWEYFYSADEMVSVSGFFKQFDGHIEVASYKTAPDQQKARNSGKSIVYGLELEMRKNINANISVGANASLMQSAVDLKSVKVEDGNNGSTEYELRKANLREGETLKSTRVMAGQSPYLINGYVNYASNDKSINANISYNVQGKTLWVVGSGLTPDIYANPFHSLNFNLSKSFGVKTNSKVTMGVQNVLGATNKLFYESYGAENKMFSVYRPGRTITLKYAWTF